MRDRAPIRAGRVDAALRLSYLLGACSGSETGLSQTDKTMEPQPSSCTGDRRFRVGGRGG
jgi:hypothetical protein